MRDIGRGAALVLAGLVAVVVVGLVLGLMSVYGVGWFSRTTADYRGKTGVINKTRGDSTYRIAAYDHFYDLDARIKALGVQVCEMKAGGGGLPADQVKTNVLALKNQRINLVEEYNADARKAGTLGQFRASDLPYQIDINQDEGCAR